MGPGAVVKSDNFLVFTKPDDFANPQARSHIASHAAKYGSRKNLTSVEHRPKKPRKAFMTWRSGSASQLVVRARSGDRQTAGRQQQSQSDTERIAVGVPMSISASPSLQNCMRQASEWS